MKININELKNIKNKKIIPAIIILIIICAVGFKACKTLWVKNIKLKAALAKKTEEMAKSADFRSLKDSVNLEIKELNGKLSSIEKRFSLSNTEGVFSSLNRFIEATDISLKAISPLEKTEVEIPGGKDKYLELPVNLRLECSFYQLLSFLNKIENSDKAMFVTDLKVQSNPNDMWEHNVELSLKVPILSLQQQQKAGKK